MVKYINKSLWKSGEQAHSAFFQKPCNILTKGQLISKLNAHPWLKQYCGIYLPKLWIEIDSLNFGLGTIHLRRQHVLGREGCPHVLIIKRSQYIRIKNPLYKHFAGMPMVGGVGVKNRENLPTS